MISPERTHAVVVGIERYEAGDRWDLDGAAGSALRIIGWLRKRQVPVGNITVLLSPLDANWSKVRSTLVELEFPLDKVRPATVDEIRRVITEQLPTKDGDLLMLFWSGHGVLDREMQRRLFCGNAAVNAKYNIKLSQLLAALSGRNFRGLRDQVIIVDACANYIQEMRLSLREPDSGFAIGDTRWVNQAALLAATQGEKASLDQKASSGTFARVVADWLDEHAPTLPPPIDQLTSGVLERFKRMRQEGVTTQHPVCIRQILHGDETEHVYGGEPVPENVWAAARSAGLATGQLRRAAAAIAATPQLGREGGRDALIAALQDVVGAVVRTDDSGADLLDLVSAVHDRHASAALFQALWNLGSNEEERIAAERVRKLWELQTAVVPVLDMLKRTPGVQVQRALAGIVCDAPADVSDVDQALERLADLRISRFGVRPLAEFVVRLQRRRPDLEVPAGWFSGQGLDEAAVAVLRRRVAHEERMRRKLVIDLRESAPSAWQAAVTGFLGPGWCTKTVKCAPDADGVRHAVREIVEWAKWQTRDLVIGFRLAYDLLQELPEQWDYYDDYRSAIPLCHEHSVVLHAAERRDLHLQGVWDDKLAAIEDSEGLPPTVLWLDRDDAAAIRRDVRASDDAYVAFTFVPEAPFDRRDAAVMAAIAEGAPYVVWMQAVPADNYDLRERLGPMMGPIQDFPQTLLQHRTGDDPYISSELRVIWDRRDELPPDLGQLGEGLVPDD